MNENDKILKHHFTEECPSAEVFENYLSGKLNAEKKSDIENHVKNCPLCSEAIEGMIMFKKDIQLTEDTKKLNELIDNNVKNQHFNKSRNIFLYVTAAASVILLLGSIFIFRSIETEKETSPQQIVKKPDIEITRADSVAVINNELPESVTKNNEIAFNNSPNGNLKAEQQNATKETNLTKGFKIMEVIEDMDDKKLTPSEAETNEVEQEVIESNTEKSTESLSEVTISSSSHKRLVNKPAQDENKKQEALKDSVDLIEYYIQNSKIAYNKGNKTDAIDFSNKAVEISPGNKEAIYNLGLMNYQLGNYKESIPYLNQIANSKNKNSSESKWYLALSYYEMKDYENAKKWLYEVIRENKKHKTDAEELLKKIENK